MLTFPLVFLAGCAGSSESVNAENSALSVAPGDPDCDKAVDDVEGIVTVIEAGIATHDNAFEAAENLLAMQALAARAATGTLGRADRAALQMEFAARLHEADRFAEDDADLDPGALGVADTHIDTRVHAGRSFVALDRALLALGSHLATVEADLDTEVRSIERAQTRKPACTLPTVEVELPDLDAATPVDEALAANVADGLALVEEVRGTTELANDILHQIRTLAIASASETMGTEGRMRLQQQYTALALELERVADTSTFAGMWIADGSHPGMTVWLRPDPDANLRIALADLRATTLAVDTGSIDLSTAANASTALTAIDSALYTVGAEQSALAAATTVLTIEQERYADDPAEE